MSSMRAKLTINNIDNQHEGQEVLNFSAVCRSEGYGEDGADENNTYAQFTPTADLRMVIQNPALLGKFEIGEEYYVDFVKAN